MDLNMKEQVALAIKMVDALFPLEEIAELPPEATRESLWVELQAYKKKKLKKPRIADAVQMLVEDQNLTLLSYEVMAKILREVYGSHKHSSRCSESSIRWYLSQCHDWEPRQRRKWKDEEEEVIWEGM